MSTKMLLTAKLDQRLVMNQQLRQAITLLQYSTLDLKQLVQHYVENNPLIDVEESESNEKKDETETVPLTDDGQEQEQLSNYSANFSKNTQYYEEDNSLENFSIPKTLRINLLEQTLLCHFNQAQQIAAEAIIDAIDEKGYLTMTLEDIQQTIIDICPISLADLEAILQQIQLFEPVGVGARHLQECLLIQLSCIQKKDKCWELAEIIITHHLESSLLNNTKKMLKVLGVSQVEYAAAMAIIRLLDPAPGLKYAEDVNINIEPELYVKKIKNVWQVFLTDSVLTRVGINSQYQTLIKHKKNKNNEALNKELQEAQWLLKGLKRRNETLLNVASFIVNAQSDFFEHGHASLKSMNIVDVSQALELHESTVSRITTGKYMATPRGVFELKFFFPSHVATQSGGVCSDTAVKVLIKEIIDQETDEHSFSDDEIAEFLSLKGINIARRTVAKYRESMKILSSYQRASRRSSFA